MHGNVWEWCQDFYVAGYYSQSPSVDPKGGSSGSKGLAHGGGVDVRESVPCRSAFRPSNVPVGNRSNDLGFRFVRVADATADARLATGTAATQPNQPWNTPAFQQWMKATQALSAEQQIEAVSKKLMELNPGFDGKVTGFDGRGADSMEEATRQD